VNRSNVARGGRFALLELLDSAAAPPGADALGAGGQGDFARFLHAGQPVIDVPGADQDAEIAPLRNLGLVKVVKDARAVEAVHAVTECVIGILRVVLRVAGVFLRLLGAVQQRTSGRQITGLVQNHSPVPSISTVLRVRIFERHVLVVIVRIKKKSLVKLVVLIDTGDSPGSGPRLIQRGQQHRRQNGG